MSAGEEIKAKASKAVAGYVEIGRGAENSVQLYSDSGLAYEEYMQVLNYNGPCKLAEAVAELLKDEYHKKILDVGAGSGLAGLELFKLGYTNLDAVDPAPGLLDIARGKGIYKQIICQYVGNEKMPFCDKSYDLVVSCGAIQENHIPLEGLRDIIRVVKPDGYVVLVYREEAGQLPWYKEGIEPFMKEIENEGAWTLISRSSFPKFIAEKSGMTLVYKVL